MSDLEARIARLESLDEIRQLAAKYSLALDMRDADAWVNLFPTDVRVSKAESGRAALKKWFDETHRVQFTGTSHHIGGHIIEFTDPDNAQGVVYSKNEHETGPEWVIMQMMYFDKYERIAGRWYFRRRLPLYWYATISTSRPSATSRCAGPAARLTTAASTSCFPHGRNSGTPRSPTHPSRHRRPTVIPRHHASR